MATFPAFLANPMYSVCVFLHRMVLILFCQNDLWCTGSLAWDEKPYGSPGSASNASYQRLDLKENASKLLRFNILWTRTEEIWILLKRVKVSGHLFSYEKWMLKIIVLKELCRNCVHTDLDGILLKRVLKEVTGQGFLDRDVFKS